jgi:hypothetical protein
MYNILLFRLEPNLGCMSDMYRDLFRICNEDCRIYGEMRQGALRARLTQKVHKAMGEKGQTYRKSKCSLRS